MRSGAQVRISLLVLALGMLLSACIVESETRFCACPKLEAVAPTIDWLGSGETPDALWPAVGLEPFQHQVDLRYEVSDGQTSARLVIGRLVDAGFSPRDLDDDPSFAVFDGDDRSVVVAPSNTGSEEDGTDLVIVVVSIADDALAQQLLQPFVDALGTVP